MARNDTTNGRIPGRHEAHEELILMLANQKRTGRGVFMLPTLTLPSLKRRGFRDKDEVAASRHFGRRRSPSFRFFVLFVLFVVVSKVARGDEPTWLRSLPESVQEHILWSADYEPGDLRQWHRPHAQHPGSGEFNTGGRDALALAGQRIVHSGRWALETTIRNAYRAQNGARAVRLMVWTDRAWDEGGQYFPDRAYYSTWLYVPHAYDPAKRPPWDPGDGGWWNVLQFKSDDAAGQSQPMWTLNLARVAGGALTCYLHSPVNRPTTYTPQPQHISPVAAWTHIEVLYVAAGGPTGQIAVYQNGQRIIDARDVVTSLGGRTGHDHHPIWGIGNYTDHITGDPAGAGQATVYFDDAAVSTKPLGPYARTAPTGEE